MIPNSKLDDVIKELKKIPSSTISDALDSLGINGTIEKHFFTTLENVRIAGPAITVKDKLSRKKAGPVEALEAIEKCEKGSVFVRAVEDSSADNVAIFGGLMALSAKNEGLAGAVILGAARDVMEIRGMGFQLYYTSRSPNTSVGRTEVVGINVPILCKNVIVNPGDFIVGDDDGIVCIPKDRVSEVLDKSKKIDELEKMETEEMKKGVSFTQVIKKYSRV